MKKKTQTVRHLRQGDVLLVLVTSIPLAAVPAKRDNGRIVLAYGEVTGHAHAITEPHVALMEIEDRELMGAAARELLASVGLTMEIRDEEVIGFVDVGAESANLSHEEHGTVALGAGEKFVALRQREYTPEAPVQVAD